MLSIMLECESNNITSLVNMPLEYQAIQKSFSAIAHQYENNAILQKEVLTRLLERLADEQTINPDRQVQHLLDLGCGTGWAAPHLFMQLPNVQITALDFSQEMLNQIKPHAKINPVLADVHDVPLADDSMDIVFSNMLLHWSNEKDVFNEAYRVLKPGGLILMSALGETSLFELKEAWSSVDDKAHVHEFPALHHLGDELLKTGFEQVVVNAEILTLTYENLMALMKDIKASGGHNSNEQRHKGLMSRSQLQQLTQTYESFRKDSRLPASYEVVYLRAIKPKKMP